MELGVRSANTLSTGVREVEAAEHVKPRRAAERRPRPRDKERGGLQQAPGAARPLDALQLDLVVIRDAGAKGLGVFAATDLEEQTFVGAYTGEVLTAQEYEQRYPRGDAQYVFQVNDDYLIDAGDPELSPGPIRYTNHSADGANIHSSVVKVKKQRTKYVHFYTSRRIEAGEELVWNYGKLYWQNDSHKII